jgi:hypothetical protein
LIAEVRIDRPDDDRLGLSRRVGLFRDLTMSELECLLLSVLAGPVVGGTPLGFPPEGETSDARKARSLGRILGYDETDWVVIGLRLEMLSRASQHPPAIRAVSRVLLERGAIDGAEVERLVEEAERG